MFLLRPDAPFQYRCTTRTRTFRVQVPEDALPLGVRNEYVPVFEPLQQTAVVRSFVRFGTDLLADDGCLEPDRTTGAHLEAALIALEQGVVAGDIASRSAAPSRKAALRAQVVEHIETRLGDRGAPPPRRDGGGARDTFLRAFQRQQGVTPREYRKLLSDLGA